MPTSYDSPTEKDESEMTESEYEDLVWLTKKAARSKLEKWRKGPVEVQKPVPEEEELDISKDCKSCYFCSYTKELNKIWYVRCTLEEPRWTVVEADLPCWKKKA